MEISMILSLGEKIKDPRKSGMVIYSVQLILFITVAAVLSGAETWNEVAAFGKSRLEFIKRFFPDMNILQVMILSIVSSLSSSQRYLNLPLGSG